MAAIGLAKRKLIIRLREGVHVLAGYRIVRSCTCENFQSDPLELRVPQIFCKVCSLWPAITASPFWARGKVLAAISDLTRMQGWRDPNKLGAQSFRKGATRAITQAGDSFSLSLLRPGQWHSSANRRYLDLGREEAQVMASILIEASDDEIPEGT